MRQVYLPSVALSGVAASSSASVSVLPLARRKKTSTLAVLPVRSMTLPDKRAAKRVMSAALLVTSVGGYVCGSLSSLHPVRQGRSSNRERSAFFI